MDFVRSLKNNPWPDLTSMFIYSKEPVCVTTREILDVMTERRDQMGIHKVLCLCTCVTDLCSSLVAKFLNPCRVKLLNRRSISYYTKTYWPSEIFFSG